jgi:hypothetical protein
MAAQLQLNSDSTRDVRHYQNAGPGVYGSPDSFECPGTVYPSATKRLPSSLHNTSGRVPDQFVNSKVK